MLPPFIIEQIRKREQEEQEEGKEQRPVLELPIPGSVDRRRPSAPADEPERGVIIIDLLG
ncbi:MAG: hypothetical protein AAGF12_01650 [Myxococcota bacterium]